MTLILTESFDYNTGGASASGKWWLTGPNFVSSVSGRTGRMSTSTGLSKHYFHPADEHATFIAGVAVKQGALAGGAPLIFYSDAGVTLHVAIRVETTGAITVLRAATTTGGGGTVLGASATGVILGTSVWQYLEAKVTLHDTTGSAEVKVDGTTVLTLTNVDTKNAGTKTVFDTIGADAVTAGGSLDDFYCCNASGTTNNDFLGPVKIEVLQPSADGASSGLTNSAGTSVSNYTYVDDPTPAMSTGDYVGGVAPAKDTYTFGNSTQTPTTLWVKGVVLHAQAAKVDATAAGLNVIARLSGTEVTATPVNTPLSGAFSTTIRLYWNVYETKPGGGVWTVADVNAAEFGIQAV